MCTLWALASELAVTPPVIPHRMAQLMVRTRALASVLAVAPPVITFRTMQLMVSTRTHSSHPFVLLLLPFGVLLLLIGCRHHIQHQCGEGTGLPGMHA